MTADRKNTLQSEPVAFRAIGYCRLSKEHGALGVSDSIANQRKLIRAYVEKQPDMELVGEFFDDGYTGTNYDRPGFRSVLEAVERGRANCVIVKDLSRLGREYVETGKYLEQTFPELGVRFIAINDDVDSAGRSSGDDIIIPIKNIMNESYCRELSKKLRAQFRIQRSRGNSWALLPASGTARTRTTGTSSSWTGMPPRWCGASSPSNCAASVRTG